MKPLTFHLPNFKCEVVRGADQEVRLEYAADEATLRARLAAEHFRIVSVETYEFEEEWQLLARKKQGDIDPSKRPLEFDATVWRKIKQFIFSLSNGMCGYCEGDVLSVDSGEVEHYRPKRSVQEEPSHPGYYWLAYDINNYVPTCANCNGGKGKSTHFPIAGTRASKPGDSLDDERPLMLHPFTMRDPRVHLRFISGTEETGALGTVVGVTPEGCKSVDIYRLRRGDLLVARQRAIESTLTELKQSFLLPEKRRPLIDDLLAGRRPYASACLAAVESWFAEKRQEIAAESSALDRRRAGNG